MAAAAANPSRPGDTAEIEAITDAMIRLLVGTPLRSDGQLTIKSLAQEAGLKRNKLTHKHTGLKDLFYALVRMQDTRPRVVDELKRTNDALQAETRTPPSATVCAWTSSSWCGSFTSWRQRTSSCVRQPVATESFEYCPSGTGPRIASP
jgi:hypothetical protein